ncbi:hypothetical protein J2Z69_003565 [Paenibacillus shirakamiensis]|uniref:YgxA-like substrate binding domain-containing protein n=1 Tax=Paenibacillus shirakamiensis TaxID=1265935 RepID=A0ABS4JLA1_9BACL|nr:hypothetical protein [Paenibacillus shirakamiensis]MBP2002492.1 hypothetical protein [Paenibacillus shirakamiensis]
MIKDDQGRLVQLRSHVIDIEQTIREQKKFSEFSMFLRRYVEAKRFSQESQFLDGFRSVLEALHHFARIELIEQGIYPEHEVWEQARHHNSVVHKLFEELTTSMETIEQRLQLALLACEFSVMSKMEDCCVFLIRILLSRREPWSIQELIRHPELIHVHEELPMVMRKLVHRSLVQETLSVHPWSNSSLREIRYWV